MSHAAHLWASQALRELLPPTVEIEVCTIAGIPTDELMPAEVAAITGAVAKRQAEFLTGRVAARRALARLGVHEHPLLPGADRAPRWPAGVVGSITHTRQLCAVAVAHAADVMAVGIDAEPREPLAERLWASVCTESERAALAAAPDSGIRAKLVFSAKEAVFKCVHPASGEFLEFADAEVQLDLEAQSIRATLLKEVPGVPQELAGRWSWDARFILTALWIPPAAPSRTDPADR